MQKDQTDNRRYPDRPFAAIGVVVWSHGEVLIVKRAKPPRAGHWGIIGGGLEVGETYFEAAIREAREETGIEIQPFSIVTAIDSISRDAENKIEFHYSIVEVNARLLRGDPKPSEEISEVRWIKPADLQRMDVWEELKRVVALAEKQRSAERDR